MFTPRLTRPTSGNKYYIRKANGGYSSAIEGKVKSTGKPDSQCNVLANCVGYAYGRFNEIGGYNACKYLSPVNAENFPEYAKGLQLGAEPKLGAIIVWQKGTTLKGADGAGHVAVVEKLNPDGSIVISQSGWNSTVFWTETLRKGDRNWRCSWMGATYKFRCFIYNPAVSEDEADLMSFVKGSKGDGVKTLQINLNKLGYNLTVDGSYGPACIAAIKDYQQKKKLTVDGLCGIETGLAIKADLKELAKRPSSIKDLRFTIDGIEKTCWATNINGQNYIRMADLVNLGLAKSVTYNSAKGMPEVTTK